MLSFRMAEVLREAGYAGGRTGSFRDGRTVHALRSRGYLTKVAWDNSAGTYTFRLTSEGVLMARNIRFNLTPQLKEMLK